MYIKKILETYIDITDPVDIFSGNIDDMLINKLKEKFVGKCCMSCLIINVNKIIKRSFIYMKDTLEGDCNVNIMFEVDAIEYIKNEIINGCKIIKKESNDIIHGISEYAGIQIKIPANISIFKEGDIIPVIVKMTRYNINQTAISVLATPFMPNNDPAICYKIRNTLSEKETDIIKNILSQIKAEELIIKNMDGNSKKIYKFFIELLSNKDNKTIKNTDILNKFNINNILDIKSGVITTPKTDFITSDIYSIKENDKNIVHESMFIAFSSILIGHLCNLQSIKGFLKYYQTIDDIKKHKNIWKLYSSMKK